MKPLEGLERRFVAPCEHGGPRKAFDVVGIKRTLGAGL
jgi:hypothetical protein